MKIQNINTPNIINFNNTATNFVNKSSGLRQDTFEKTVSFNGFFDPFLKTLNEMDYIKKELSLKAYFDIFNDKKTQNALKQCAGYKINKLHDLINVDSLISREYVESLLAEAGLSNVQNVRNFSRNFLNNPDAKVAFNYQTIEAVKIYGILNRKENFNKYPDLLLHLYNEEEAKKNPDFDKLNTYADFLSNIGLNSSKDFDTKFAHLKSAFNEFESIPDKLDAVDYLLDTYSDKKIFIDELFKNERIDFESFYRKHNDVVDYAYIDVQNGSDENYLDILKTVSMSEKLKSSVKNKLADDFNNFKTFDDKIFFCQFLIDSNVTPNECNKLLSKSIISDGNYLHNIYNKDSQRKNLTTICKNHQKASDFYFDFKDTVNAIQDTEETDLTDLVEVTKRFNIKNQDDLLNFYNKCSNQHVKNITKNDLNDFIELFKYSDSEKLLDEAKNQKTTVVELLQAEKQNYQQYKETLTEFILNDETNYFAGKTPLDLYKNYKSIIIENPDNISSVLENVVNFNILGSQEYNDKLTQISKFEEYIPDKKVLAKFFSDNQITFEEDDEEYMNSCLDIVKTLSENSNSTAFEDKIRQLSDNKFLVKSKTYLPDFLALFDNELQKKEVLELITDKNVPSVKEWKNLLREYKAKGVYDENIVSHLKSQGDDIDFTTYSKILNNIAQKIDKYNLPFSIKNKNITKLGEFTSAMQNKVSDSQLIEMLNNITGTPQGCNFISLLPKAFVDTPKKYSAFHIADEIALIHEKDGESYRNIEKQLHISKEELLNNQAAGYYTYVKCIEEKLPQEFIDFVNSPEIYNFTSDETATPNLTLHARLRAIDRFLLKDTPIEKMYTKESVQKLQEILKVLYTQTPEITEKNTTEDKRMVFEFDYGKDTIKTVFGENGALVTFIIKD